MLCCWRNIALGAAIMECSSDFLSSNIRVITLPVISFIVSAAFFLYWVATAVFLYSIGEPEFRAGRPIANIKWDDSVRYLIWYFFFGLLWCMAFLICLQQFMIAAMVCMWYFSGQG